MLQQWMDSMWTQLAEQCATTVGRRMLVRKTVVMVVGIALLGFLVMVLANGSLTLPSGRGRAAIPAWCWDAGAGGPRAGLF